MSPRCIVSCCSNKNKMADEESEESLVQAFAAFPTEDTEKRPTCKRCKRPSSVCLCPYLPEHLMNIKTTVHILQHPKEESRLLTTVPILEASLQQEKCLIYRERRFHEPDYQELYNILSQPNSLLLYPGPQAVDLKTLDLTTYPEYNLIVLDGTWRQARNIFHGNNILNNMKQVVVEHHNISEYVIRTQPTNQSLCTVEAVALALAVLEDDMNIYKSLINPLKALCQFQLDHGALVHCSKEEKEKELLKEMDHTTATTKKKRRRRKQKLKEWTSNQLSTDGPEKQENNIKYEEEIS